MSNVLFFSGSNYRGFTRALVSGSTLSNEVTFTRASTGTYFDSDGVLQTAAIDEPRFTYLQDGSGTNGLLIESTSTNFITQSDISNWTINAGASKTDDALVSPDGTTNAAQVTTDTSAFSGFFSNTVSYTSGNVYTASIFFKYISGLSATQRFRFEAGFTSAFIDLDVSTGVVSSTGAGIDHSTVLSLENGWYRIEITATATSTTSGVVSAYDNDGTNGGVYGYWGAQVEEKPWATSLIYTTGSAATRSADVPTVVLSTSPWYNQSAGTLFIDATSVNNPQTSLFRRVVSLDDGSTDNRIGINRSSGTLRTFISDSAVIQNDQEIGLWADGTRIKAAFGFELNDLATSLDGATVVTDSSATTPSGLTTMRIGHDVLNRYFDGIITQLNYYGFRQSNASLESITENLLYISLVEAGVLNSRVTFSRASSATYFDVNGSLQTATTDTPRISYSQDGSGEFGLLLEGARTNTLRNNTMDGAGIGVEPTNWTAIASNIGGTGVSSTITATGTTSSGLNYIDVNFAGTSTGSSGLSIAMDTITGTAATNGQERSQSVFLSNPNGASNGINVVRNDLLQYDAGSSPLSSITGTNNISSLTTSLVRFEDSLTTNDASVAFVRPRIEVTWTSGEVIDFTLRIALPQLELGSFASSVIKTTSAAVTRAADIVTLPLDIAPWFNPAEGTLYNESMYIGDTGTAAGRTLYELSDGTANETIGTGVLSGGNLGTYVVDGGVTQASISNVASAELTPYKVASAYEVNNFAISTDGATVATDVSGTLPTVTLLTIGNTGTGSNEAFALEKVLRYYTRRLTDTQLEEIST